MEHLLRGNTHKDGCEFLNALLTFLCHNQFYWLDFAPRNIIISESRKLIILVDFERGINASLTPKHFLTRIYEEYMIFLLPSENILSKKVMISLQPADTEFLKQSKRIKTIKEVLAHRSIVVSNVDVFKELLRLEEPIVAKNEIYFPVVGLDDLLSKNGYYSFAVFISSIIVKRGCIC